MKSIVAARLTTALVLGLVVSLQLSCRDDTAVREAEDAKRQLAAEQEARKAAEDAKKTAEEARKAAEKRYVDLRKEKERSNGAHKLEQKEAGRKIGTLSILSISSVLALTVLILLLARERSLRRIVGAALTWVLGRAARDES